MWGAGTRRKDAGARGVPGTVIWLILKLLPGCIVKYASRREDLRDLGLGAIQWEGRCAVVRLQAFVLALVLLAPKGNKKHAKRNISTSLY